MDSEQTFLEQLKVATEAARQAEIQAYINYEMARYQSELVHQQMKYEEERLSTLRHNQE